MKLEAQKQSRGSPRRILSDPNHPFFQNPSQTFWYQAENSLSSGSVSSGKEALFPSWWLKRKRSQAHPPERWFKKPWSMAFPLSKMEGLAHSLGIQIALLPVTSWEITTDLTDQVEWFRTRPLEKEYPVIGVDALDEKVRCEGRVISMAIAVVQGLTKDGNRANPGGRTPDSLNQMRPPLSSLHSSKDEEWKPSGCGHQALLQDWKNAILEMVLRIKLATLSKYTVGEIYWFIFPIKKKNPPPSTQNRSGINRTTSVFKQYAHLVIQEYRDRFPQAIALFKEGLEDSFQFLAFPHLDQRKTSSTNSLERIHKEIRRWTRVVGIFPTTDSYLRLVTSYLIEYTQRLDEE